MPRHGILTVHCAFFHLPLAAGNQSPHVPSSVLRPPSFLSSPWLFLRWHLTLLNDKERHGLERGKEFLTKGSQPNLKLWDILWPTLPLVYWHVYTRSLSPGQMITHGLMTKVSDLVKHCHQFLLTSTIHTVYSVLAWVSIYWFSRPHPAASVRIYYEVANAGGIGSNTTPVRTPSGVTDLPGELFRIPNL